ERRHLVTAHQPLFTSLAIGDVSRDSQNDDHVAVAVAQRHLRGRDPSLSPIALDIALFDVDERYSGGHDLLLALAKCLGEVLLEEVEVSGSDDLSRRGDATRG